MVFQLPEGQSLEGDISRRTTYLSNIKQRGKKYTSAEQSQIVSDERNKRQSIDIVFGQEGFRTDVYMNAFWAFISSEVLHIQLLLAGNRQFHTGDIGRDIHALEVAPAFAKEYLHGSYFDFEGLDNIPLKDIPVYWENFFNGGESYGDSMGSTAVMNPEYSLNDNVENGLLEVQPKQEVLSRRKIHPDGDYEQNLTSYPNLFNLNRAFSGEILLAALVAAKFKSDSKNPLRYLFAFNSGHEEAMRGNIATLELLWELAAKPEGLKTMNIYDKYQKLFGFGLDTFNNRINSLAQEGLVIKEKVKTYMKLREDLHERPDYMLRTMEKGTKKDELLERLEVGYKREDLVKAITEVYGYDRNASVTRLTIHVLISNNLINMNENGVITKVVKDRLRVTNILAGENTKTRILLDKLSEYMEKNSLEMVTPTEFTQAVYDELSVSFGSENEPLTFSELLSSIWNFLVKNRRVEVIDQVLPVDEETQSLSNFVTLSDKGKEALQYLLELMNEPFTYLGIRNVHTEEDFAKAVDRISRDGQYLVDRNILDQMRYQIKNGFVDENGLPLAWMGIEELMQRNFGYLLEKGTNKGQQA